jgi:peptidoglycan/xylan/chitin deacetylase (PgdA/CDA1 family)
MRADKREQEMAVLDKCIDLVTQVSGRRPTGYVAPWWEFSTVRTSCCWSASVIGARRSPAAARFVPDSPLEQAGFELVWGFSCQVVVLGFSESSLFGAGKPFFIPSPAIRFAEGG